MNETNIPPLTPAPTEEMQPSKMAVRDLYNYYLNEYDVRDEKNKESYEDQTKALLEARLTTLTELPPVDIFLSMGGVSLIEGGDIYGIKGKPKTGKTSANKAIVTACLKGEFCGIKAEKPDLKVLYIDSEQKPGDTFGILKNIMYQAEDISEEYINSHLQLMSLRKRDYSKLPMDMLRLILEFRPEIIIIDGIADFVPSFNDEVSSKNLILLELRIVEDFGCAIINLIHENKAYEDHNAKGHLGQLLTQKASIMMETKKEGEIIKITNSESRHKAIPDWYLMYDGQGMLINAKDSYSDYLAAKKSQAKQIVELERVKLAYSIIEEAEFPINRAELSRRMADKLNMARSTLSSFITSQLGKTLFIVDDKIYKTPEGK